MKKLFGLFVIAMALVLASCGNGLSDETGDVSFSIPGNQLVRMVASARNGKTSEGNSTKIAVIVQVMGSKGYYASQTQETSYTSSANGNVGQSSSNLSGNTTLVVENPVVNAVKDLTFSFPKLPVSQRYTIYLDVLSSYEEKGKVQEEKWSINYSGESSDVRIKANASTPVEMKVSSFRGDTVGLQVTYTKDGKSETKIASCSELCDKWDEATQKTKPPVYSFAKKDGEDTIYFGAVGINSYPVTDIKLVPVESSHFIDFGKCDIYKDPDSQNQKQSILDIIKGSDDDAHFATVMRYNDYLISGDSYYLKISKNMNGFGGNKTDNVLFTMNEDNDVGGRYVAMIPFENIIGNHKVQKGETIVFVLYMKQLQVDGSADNIFGTVNLQYSFQKTQNPSTSERYNKNVTVNQSTGGLLIMPANMLNGDEKYLQLYLDYSGGANYISGMANILYKIYPAEEKVYALFSTYDGEDKRYELNYDLTSFFEGKTIVTDTSNLSVTIGGKVELDPWETATARSVSGAVFNAELYDNTTYGEENDPWYHPLSQDAINGITNTGNRKTWTLDNTGTMGTFVFAKIKNYGKAEAPYVNDLRFRCYNTSLVATESGNNGPKQVFKDLLIIRNFSITPVFN